jgi:ergothioneine biosynthesis protein EgtB
MTGFFMLPDLHFTGPEEFWQDARTLPRRGVAQALVDARSRTLGLLAALGVDERVPRAAASEEFSPPQWTLGYLAWYGEKWCLRDPTEIHGPDGALWEPGAPTVLDGADAWFDADRIPPDARWEVSLPALSVIKLYAAGTLERILARLAILPDEADETLEPFRLSLFREVIEAESLVAMLQALGRPMPGSVARMPAVSPASPLHFEGSSVTLGRQTSHGLAFDNETPPQSTYVPAFEIDATPVTHRQFLEFVEDAGYDNPAWWSPAGQQWMMFQERSVPRYWSRQHQDAGRGVRWHMQRFGQQIELAMDEPICHLSLFEAEAWCRWAGRRLPKEEEWELAATRSNLFQWGIVREWTGSIFEPYAGFIPGRDDTWSLPYFGLYQAVRGAAWITPAMYRHPAFRGVAEPGSDLGWIGFRSCAV